MSQRIDLTVCMVLFTPALAIAGSIGTYSGCKPLGASARAACERCVGSGSFYQPASGSCGMTADMHVSKAIVSEKPPPRPKAMPQTGKDYVTITGATFDIGARATDENKDEKELFDARVTLTHSFAMKTTEVTQGEWLYILGNVSPSFDKKCGLDCPAGAVSWNEAVAYLNALSKKENLEPCYEIVKGLAKWSRGFDCTGYRLPTEAEWELAARGGSEEPRYGEVQDIAWYYDNSDGSAHPVGKKKKNAFGLFDMLGNVWEWTWDAYEYKPYTEDVTDPIIGGLSSESVGQNRIMRGGSYRDNAIYVRASHRFQYLADSGSNEHGFRPVRTIVKK